MIELQGISKQFGPEGPPAIDGLDLAIAAGEVMVLIGESGSGKTTTLNLINRLAEPSAGTIRIDGQDATTADPVTLRRHMGYVFQGVGLFPHMTVGENVAITPRLLGWEKPRIAARVTELLALVRLPVEQYRDRYPAELSGGQRQRIGLARALAAEPHIMLMDEPFGALDPLTRDDLATDFLQIHRELKLTTVLVTHDMTEAFMLGNRVAVMRDGKIAQIGTPQDLAANPADDFVRTLIETPRRRARELAAIMQAGPA